MVAISAACGGDDKPTATPGASNATPATASSPAAAGATAISVKTFKFDPTPLKVKAGTKVSWTNNDEILHTVTSGAPGMEDGKFNGEMESQGKTFSFTFATPGTYTYFCSRHNGMRGEVDVS